jgi:hypothetical protein
VARAFKTKKKYLTMEQKYRISTWNKVFYGVIATMIFGFSLYLSNLPKTKNSILIFIPLLLFFISTLIVVNFIKRKLVISENSILCINLFSRKELKLNAIKGYRSDGKSIKIEPILKNDTILSIGNYIDFENATEILEWSKKNLKDLDALDLENEHQKLLKDASLGFSEIEREEKIKSTKEICVAYNFIGGFLAFIVLFIDQKFSYVILLILPLIGIILLYNFKLIKFISNSKRSIYGYIFIGFAIPCFTLLLKTTEFNLLNLDNIWIPVGIIFCITLALLSFKGINKSVESVIGQIIAMVLFSFLYGFGSIRAINCEFDKSKLLIFNATVIDHSISHGKKTTYYLRLSTWGPQHKEEDEEISKNMYHKTKIGDLVNIKYKEGFLKAPWFVISSNNDENASH